MWRLLTGKLYDKYQQQCCGGQLVSDQLTCCGDQMSGTAYSQDVTKQCCGTEYMETRTSVCCTDGDTGHTQVSIGLLE